MTVAELITLLEAHPENTEVRLQFGDAGGYYEGDGPLLDVDVCERDGTKIVVLS